MRGGILPSLENQYSDLTAIPATRIINYSLANLKWLDLLRLETQTPIPKCDNVASFDQLRNLSCTNSLSKIMESFVIEKLREETKISKNQFGGIKGSGCNHFLIECWQKILLALDRPETAVSLVSIDFSKAFNRVCHHACVRALVEAGASTETLAMIHAFYQKGGCASK